MHSRGPVLSWMECLSLLYTYYKYETMMLEVIPENQLGMTFSTFSCQWRREPCGISEEQ